MSDCILKGYKTFNNECYKTCPANTFEKYNNGSCYCSYFYYNNLETNSYVCLSQNEECITRQYDYKIDEANQCFSSLKDCRDKGFKTFNNKCYTECPENTFEKDSNGICYCSYFYYNNLETNLYECLSQNEECITRQYNYKIDDEKQCFNSLSDCKIKGYKIFNNQCYSTCPENTYEKNNDDICSCSNYYYKNYVTGLYVCLAQDEECISRQYNYKIDNEKQCFDSLSDCILKGYKTFNNECYTTCPENTYEKIDEDICYCSYFYYNNLETNNYICLSQNEECASRQYDYKIDEEKQCFSSLGDYRSKGFKTFNNKCYTECPENTFEKNDDDICYCSYFYYNNFQTNLSI